MSCSAASHAEAHRPLALTAEVSGTGTVYLLPAMSHGRLGTGQSFEFEALPALETGFQAISGTISASAAGVVTSTAFSLSLPSGTSMYLGEATLAKIRSGVLEFDAEDLR